MGVNIYYLELIFILVNVFQQYKLMKRDILTETLFLQKKHKKHQKKNLGCKIIRINTSNAKNGYDLDYEVGNVQAFIDEFKNKKIKKLEKEMREKLEKKEKEIREKLEKKMREKVKKEMRQKLEKELKDKNKKINKQRSY